MVSRELLEHGMGALRCVSSDGCCSLKTNLQSTPPSQQSMSPHSTANASQGLTYIILIPSFSSIDSAIPFPASESRFFQWASSGPPPRLPHHKLSTTKRPQLYALLPCAFAPTHEMTGPQPPIYGMPPEVLCLIADACELPKEARYLALASKHLHKVLDDHLYDADAKSSDPVALQWAVEVGATATANKANLAARRREIRPYYYRAVMRYRWRAHPRPLEVPFWRPGRQ